MLLPMPFTLFFFAASLATLRRSSLYGAVVNLPFTAFVQCIPHNCPCRTLRNSVCLHDTAEKHS